MPLDYLATKLLWRVPWRFKLISLLGPSYSLRCVLFHHIADESSLFTDGLSITITREAFESCIRFLSRHYTPVSLETVLSAQHGVPLPERPVLVTFDDAYASVAEVAAPVCQKYNVPATFFVNAAFLDNREMSLDNLLCYVTNKFGFEKVKAFTQVAQEYASPSSAQTVEPAKSQFLTLPPERRTAFAERLSEYFGLNRCQLACQARLYLSTEQLRSLIGMGFEIGNHTRSHVHCRSMSDDDLVSEVIGNQQQLESITRTKVRSFSVPYGSSVDLTPSLLSTLRSSGHQVVFLSESLPNTPATDLYRMSRVSLHGRSDEATFAEIEAFPRARAIRNRLSPRRVAARA